VARVLIIPHADSPLPGWVFRDFTVERAEREADGVRRLRDQTYDAAVVNGTDGLGELCTSLFDAFLTWAGIRLSSNGVCRWPSRDRVVIQQSSRPYRSQT